MSTDPVGPAPGPTPPPAPSSSGGEATTELDLLFRQAAVDVPEEGEEHHDDDEGPVHKKRRRSSVSEKGIESLNLTAMMDMMTIILVFLLKSYATTPENVQMSDMLTPPRSTAHLPMDVAVAITLTKQGILVDDKPIVQLDQNGKIVDDPPNTGQLIQPLFDHLQTDVANMKAIADRGGPPFEGKLLIVADEKTNYALLMRVLYTAGTAQFAQYKLVVRSQNANQTMNGQGG